MVFSGSVASWNIGALGTWNKTMFEEFRVAILPLTRETSFHQRLTAETRRRFAVNAT